MVATVDGDGGEVGVEDPGGKGVGRGLRGLGEVGAVE